MKKIAIVTGASSGIGAQTAIALMRAGHTVIGGARHVSNLPKLSAAGIDLHPLDVTDSQSNQSFVNYVLQHYGRIDVLVNSAGYGSFGALAEVPMAEAKRQLDVNLFGMMDLIQKVLPTMQAQHSGRIVNISSMAGQVYSAMAGWYFVSKHAMETMSDVLRLEVAQFGIDVVIIEPGVTKSNWANVTKRQLLKVTPKESPYRQLAEKQAQLITKGGQSATAVAAVILRSIQAKHPKIRYQAKLRDTISIKLLHFLSDKARDRAAKKLMA